MPSGSKLQGMGMYVRVRGWVEIAHKQRDQAQRLIDAFAELRPVQAMGWVLPAAFNWSSYVMYGGDVREVGLPELRSVVEGLAALPAVDEDNDLPAGFFFLSDERGQSVQWSIRDGVVTTTGIEPAHLQWLTER